MKKSWPFWFSALCGILAMVLRAALFAFCIDEKGLIAASCLPSAIWAVAAAALVGGVSGFLHKQSAFPEASSSAAAAGSLLFAVGLVISGLLTPHRGIDFLRPFLLPLSAAAGLTAAYGGLCRLQKKAQSIWCYAPAIVYLIVFMVYRYRVWSARPQLMEHAFDVLSCVSLTLTLYWHCAATCDLGNEKKKEVYSLLCLFFSVAALGHTEALWLYLTAALWLVTNTCVKKDAP